MSASFAVLGVSLVLSGYLLVATLLSLAVALAARLRGSGRWDRPGARARLLFAACVLPTAAGLLAALGLVLPAWLVHEPLGTDEQPGPALLLVAGTAGVLVMTAVRKAFAGYRRTARAVAAWSREARPLGIPRLDVPALRVEYAFPLAAVAGIRRPRLLLAGVVVDALTPDELRAVAAHESGHLAAGDVLKRLVLRACPDPLRWTGVRARLEESWERAAEAAADDFAARRVPRIHLASALVKIASLVPPGRALGLELPAFAAAGAPVATRVHDLLAGEATPRPPESLCALYVAIGVGAAAGLALLPFALPATHRFLEAIVTALS